MLFSDQHKKLHPEKLNSLKKVYLNLLNCLFMQIEAFYKGH